MKVIAPLKRWKFSIVMLFIHCYAFLYSPAIGQQKETMYLSGTDNEHTVDWEFYCTGGRNSGYWTTIPVPSHWEQHGFGTYNYGRDYKTNGKNFHFADEQGKYKYKFNVPSSWKGKQLKLVFEGSMTDTEVKINGKHAGDIHRGAFYRFSYNVTDKVVPGDENTMEIVVSKMSSDATVNNAERLADYWVLGGIFRPVYLEAYPTSFIENLAIDASADGAFNMKSALNGNAKQGKLVATIKDANGSVVKSIEKIIAAGTDTVIVNEKLNNVKTWTPEFPNRYIVNVQLFEGAKMIYQTEEKFGFRTVEIRHGDGIYVNGVQVKMKGVNRHVWWPETGRSVNARLDIQDVLLIKGMNMNAVRCSHYPPDVSFLDACDSLGLFVLDELAGWQTAYSEKAGAPLVKSMILRDQNHPSVIFWNNGNEGGTNKALDDDFVQWDYTKRPVLHPHHRPGNAFNGIDCDHYEDYNSTKRKLQDSLIYMPTEFLHAQDDGGAGAAMRDFWELHWTSKRSGGGFIWSFVDEAVRRTDMNNVLDANGLNANDGILGPHREKEGSYFALKEIFSPVHIDGNALPVDFNGRIPVENRFHYTNLKACKFSWKLLQYRNAFDVQAGYMIAGEGNITAPDIAPLAKGYLNLELPPTYSNADAVTLSAYDPYGNELYTWVYPLKGVNYYASSILKLKDELVKAEETDTTIVLSGGDVSVTISKQSGLLLKAKNAKGDNLSFGNGPVLTDGKAVLKSYTLSDAGKRKVLECRFEGNMNSIKWTMDGSGWLGMEYVYTPDSGRYAFSGVSFSYPENYVLGTKWLGKGPYRQWKNRTAGATLNVWQNLYNNTHTGYSPVVYPEFKGYYSNVSWMEFNTVEGKFYVATPDTGLSVRLFHFYGLSGARPHPELPNGDISFLECIPPIGTKLALGINYNTASLGPESEKQLLNKTIRRTLYFYFGYPQVSDAKELYSRPDIDNVF